METQPDSAKPGHPSHIHPDDDEIDLGKIARTLWRGKWIIAVCTVLSLLVAADQLFRVEVPLYSATASVVLEGDSQAGIMISDFDPSLSVDWYTLGTQSRILTSRQLAEKVVLRAGLLDDPYFNPHAKTRDDSRRVERQIGIMDLPGLAFGWTRKTLDNLMSPEAESPAPAPARPPTEQDILTATADAALAAVSIRNDNETYVYDITATTPFPETSARLATAWAEVYVQDQRDVKIEETQRATGWLGEQAGLLKAELEASETALSRFSANIDLINAESLEVLNQQLKLTRERLQREAEQADDLRERLDALIAAYDARIEDVPSRDLTLDNVTLLTQDGTGAGIADAPPLPRAAPPWQIPAPQTQDSDERERQQARRIIDLQGQIRASEQRQSALSDAIEELETRVAVQSEELVRYEQMTREVEANRVIHDFFMTKLREVSLQSETLQSDSRVLASAMVPGAPVSPRKSRVMALAVILGVMIGAGIVLAREYLNTRFRTPDELSEATGYLVMGMIPDIAKPTRREILRFLIDNPLSRTAEAFRNLRTSVRLSNVDAPPKVIMVTSSTAGEGKSTVSVALAASFAGMNKKVLLVECDIRRKTFVDFFGKQREKGLISVLAGQADVHDCVYNEEELGCDILFADAPTINSVDLFSSEKFAELLRDAADVYDIVILDTPPILIVSDARVIAPQTDARLFVTQWNKTSIKNVQNGLRSLREIGAPATGLVMSRISLLGMRSYADRSDPSYDRASAEYYHEA